MQTEAEPEALASLLTFLWTDLRYDNEQPEDLVFGALLRSAEAISNSTSWSDPNAALHRLCAKLFDALVVSAPHIKIHSPAFQAFSSVLTCKSIDLQSSPSLEWVQLANSVSAIWPTETGKLFEFLDSNSLLYECALEYVCAIAYPTRDHPWSRKPVELWRRYRDTELLRWPSSACQRLDDLLTPERVRERLRTPPPGLRPQFGASLPDLLDELIHIQLGSDYLKRRRILLKNLINDGAALVWDDEWGMA